MWSIKVDFIHLLQFNCNTIIAIPSEEKFIAMSAFNATCAASMSPVIMKQITVNPVNNVFLTVLIWLFLVLGVVDVSPLWCRPCVTGWNSTAALFCSAWLGTRTSQKWQISLAKMASTKHGRTARFFGPAATLCAGPKVFHHEQNFEWLSAGSAGILGKQFGDVEDSSESFSRIVLLSSKFILSKSGLMDFLGSSGRGKSLCIVGFHVLVNGWIIISISKSPFISPTFFTPGEKRGKKISTDLLVFLVQPFVNWEKAQLGEIVVILFQFYRLKISLKTLIKNLDWEFQESKAEKYFDFKIRTTSWKRFHRSWTVEKLGKFILKKKVKFCLSCYKMWGNSWFSLSLGRF